MLMPEVLPNMPLEVKAAGAHGISCIQDLWGRLGKDRSSVDEADKSAY